MLVSQMYPETRLRAKHLPIGVVTVVTIRQLDYFTITNDGGQPEIVYTLFLEEFKLPMKLKMTDAKALGAQLSEDTDNWPGAVIGIQPRMLKIGNDPEEKWTIDIYPKLNPGMLPSIPRNSDPQIQWTQSPGMPPLTVHGALPAARGAAPGQLPTMGQVSAVIGDKGVVVANEFAKRKEGLGTFYEWLISGSGAPAAISASIEGVPLSEWPSETLPWIKKYLGMKPVSGGQLLPSEAAKMANEIIPGTQRSEVINTSTGEVLDTSLADIEGPTGAESQVAGFQPQQPQHANPQPPAEDFSNDDIPF